MQQLINQKRRKSFSFALKTFNCIIQGRREVATFCNSVFLHSILSMAKYNFNVPTFSKKKRKNLGNQFSHFCSLGRFCQFYRFLSTISISSISSTLSLLPFLSQLSILSILSICSKILRCKLKIREFPIKCPDKMWTKSKTKWISKFTSGLSITSTSKFLSISQIQSISLNLSTLRSGIQIEDASNELVDFVNVYVS